MAITINEADNSGYDNLPKGEASYFHTDYHNQEFVVADLDGRWIGFGIKEEK